VSVSPAQDRVGKVGVSRPTYLAVNFGDTEVSCFDFERDGREADETEVPRRRFPYRSNFLLTRSCPNRGIIVTVRCRSQKARIVLSILGKVQLASCRSNETLGGGGKE
jgi:hypothetical protein